MEFSVLWSYISFSVVLMMRVSTSFGDQGDALDKSCSSTKDAYTITREHRRLRGHRIKMFSSLSQISCGLQCVRNLHCVSTNFKVSTSNKGGECELNDHGVSSLTDEGELEHVQGVVYTQYHIESDCSSGPCQNNGTCVSKYEQNTYTCVCPAGYTEKNCEKEMDECASSPCFNGGTCNDLINGYNCSCAPGYEGERCENDIDDCASGPCPNGTTCHDLVNDYNCTCPPGFTGNNCSENIDECASNPCLNEANCTDLVNGYNCSCAPGYEGERCENDIDDCASGPCPNGATCHDLVNDYNCTCPPGFTGNNCSENIDECASNPCLNEANCTDLVNGYNCSCAPGYEGERCENHIDDCASGPCPNGATCHDLVNDYNCTCPPGFTGNNCSENIDECASNPCLNEANCTDLVNGYNCSCAPGYEGERCENDIDDCASGPCPNGATCHDLVNDYNCSCPPGFTGNNCSEILRDCSALLKGGRTQSGVYSVDPDDGGLFSVYCDMQTDGGGWTVFQRRQDGSVDFYRGWNDYKSGFGQLTGEFWLGNDKIHRLTANRSSSLRVELEDWNGARVYAKYGRFSIGDEQAQYRLEVGSYSGSAGDSLAVHNNTAFSTKDRDHDKDSGGNCAVYSTGAWWYNACYHSNLNGKYLGYKSDSGGVWWGDFRGLLSLKFTEMKLRPSS